MARSKKKFIFVHRSQYPKFFYNEKKKKWRKHCYKCIIEKNVKIGPYYFFWNRSSVINKRLINKRFALYNGFIFHIINTDDNYRGFKLGEFSTTRRTPSHKGKQRQIKKREKTRFKRTVANKFSPIIKKYSKASNRQKARQEKQQNKVS